MNKLLTYRKLKYFLNNIFPIKMRKNLAVFDFDHTIIDDNSDTAIINLVGRNKIPNEVTKLHKSDGWTAYMQGIFKVLYDNKVDETAINNYIKTLPPVHGMLHLITELHDNLNYDIVIVSDSNSYFITAWLEAHNLGSKILRVFTNPARFEKGLLLIEMYHFQETCKLSTKNLCKGLIMQDFVRSQIENVQYEKIVYVGDGLNDFCPILRLSEKDIACVREKYKCVECIEKAKAGNYLDENGENYVVKANVCVWKDGNNILEYIVNSE